MVDYIAQCSFTELYDSDFIVTFELYNVSTEALIDKFVDKAKNTDGLLAIMQEKIPEGFMKIPGASSRGKTVLPPVVGGIRDLERAVDYEFNDEKRYLASVSTEPQGAALSFDGVPDDRCSRTPCKTEFSEGNVRIIARLEQYETADTTVSIKRNNQNIAIILKPNFGVLEIEPAYSDGIGKYDSWSLAINDKSYSLGEIRLSPGNYTVRLNHECYENIGFTAGIHKGKREVFDMSRHIALKKVGLVLRAERNGEPASEPVFVNGRQVGETPFSGPVPLCARIEIGKSREKVNVELKHNDKVEYVVSGTREQRMERERQEAEALRKADSATDILCFECVPSATDNTCGIKLNGVDNKMVFFKRPETRYINRSADTTYLTITVPERTRIFFNGEKLDYGKFNTLQFYKGELVRKFNRELR